MPHYDYADASQWRGTTILSVRKNGKVVVVGDGQVSAGNTVMKAGARKVRTLAGGKVITCLLYTSPSPRDKRQSRMPSSA